MELLPIRDIITQVEAGQIRIPAFQRGFVWEPERVAHFIDTLYKGYPFGSLLFWRTNERLKVERRLGPFDLPKPKEDYPIDYVLDGQQRVTSIYATFQTLHPMTGGDDEEEWKDIYFDHTLADGVQEPQFFALSPDEVDPKRHFPVRVLFHTTAYRQATKGFDDKLANRIDNMQSRFKETTLPVQIFRTDDKSTVAVIFERINRQGVPLNTLQLLSAWTWSEDFQLQAQFVDLIEELESKGFDAGTFDENLLLRCASAILVSNPRPEAIVTLPGDRIRGQFDEVINGILGALDFLQMNLNVRRIENLPFQTLLVPLSVFFAVPSGKEIVVTKDQRERLLLWFWKACFARRYSSGVIEHLEDDIKSILQLKGGQASNLGTFSAEVGPDFFLRHTFRVSNVNTKTFVLFLAQQHPLSFVSGTPVDLNQKLRDYNKAEFHHLMPKAYVKTLSKVQGNINCLANHCFLSRAENNHLGGVRPSEYRAKMPANVADILNRALCPESLFSDKFDPFLDERAAWLTSTAKKLLV